MKFNYRLEFLIVWLIIILSSLSSCSQTQKSDLVGNWKGTMDWSTRKSNESPTIVYYNFVDKENYKNTQMQYGTSVSNDGKYKIVGDTVIFYTEDWELNSKNLIRFHSKTELVLTNIFDPKFPLTQTTTLKKEE